MKTLLTGSLLAFCCAISSGADLPAIVRKVEPGVVAVGTHLVLRREQDALRGTGFAVGDGRHVVTNSHVVPRNLDKARRESVAVYRPERGGRLKMHKATVVKRDIVHDLCLLRVQGGRIKPLPLGRTADVREGSTVAFTGYPILNVLWLYPATHEGIVSAVAPLAFPPDLEIRPKQEDLAKIIRPFTGFRLDATAYPGNSGSPLVDADSGRVVGVLNSVQGPGGKGSAIADPSGVSFAIPVGYVRRLLELAGVKHE